MGRPSSHFKCRSLHVKQPVRTRFGLLAAWVSVEVALPSTPFAPPPLAAFITGLSVLLLCSRFILLTDGGLLEKWLGLSRWSNIRSSVTVRSDAVEGEMPESWA
jgi:hypothetical protein